MASSRENRTQLPSAQGRWYVAKRAGGAVVSLPRVRVLRTGVIRAVRLVPWQDTVRDEAARTTLQCVHKYVAALRLRKSELQQVRNSHQLTVQKPPCPAGRR